MHQLTIPRIFNPFNKQLHVLRYSRYWALKATDVFVDDGDMMSDKKLGIERLQVAVATASCHPSAKKRDAALSELRKYDGKFKLSIKLSIPLH